MMSRVSSRVSLILLSIGLVLAAVFACSKNDPVEPTHETAIRGKVVDVGAGAAAESLEVWISPPGTTMVYTNARGEYAFTRLKPGSYDLYVMKGFYEIKSRTVAVRNEQTTKADFNIEKIVDDSQFDFWGKFRWHHYYISKTAWLWADARLLAMAQGGHMVTIADASEDSLVSEIAKSRGAHVAIGLNDVVKEGTWVWVTGEPFSYSHWQPGEPNNSNNEDYGMLFVLLGTWNDYSGVTPLYFVLEIE